MNRAMMIATAVAAAAFATPAMAVTYDVADFGAPFSYAQYDGGTSFTLFTNPCSFGLACVAGPEGAGNSQVVYDAGNVLIAHPGTVGTTAIIFTAPTSSTYSFNGSAALVDGNGPGTDGVTVAGYARGTLFPIGALTPPVGGPASSASFSGLVTLVAGQQVALILGNNGTNQNDSTAISGTITSVPEPATWAMMIGGMGLAGGALRRRRSTRVTFA